MELLQNTWNIVHENFMVLYGVFVGLNNNNSIRTMSDLKPSLLTDPQKITVSMNNCMQVALSITQIPTLTI